MLRTLMISEHEALLSTERMGRAVETEPIGCHGLAVTTISLISVNWDVEFKPLKQPQESKP